MSEKSREGLLGRWSRLKRESTAGKEGDSLTLDGGAAESAPADVTGDIERPKSRSEPLPELPSIDELDPDSDFAAFMDPGVDDDVRRAALKALFRDPDFNVTDGLDVYAEDYTKLEKLTPAMVAALRYAQRTLFGENDKHQGGRSQTNDLRSGGDGNADRAEPDGGNQGANTPSGAELHDPDNERMTISEAEPEQPLVESLHTQTHKN